MNLLEILKVQGTYLFCPRCGSPAVMHERPLVEQDKIQRVEKYTVKCQRCGLSGRVTEMWDWGAENE